MKIGSKCAPWGTPNLTHGSWYIYDYELLFITRMVLHIWNLFPKLA